MKDNSSWYVLSNYPKGKDWDIRTVYTMKDGERLYASNDMKFEKCNMKPEHGNYFTTYIAQGVYKTKHGLKASYWVHARINLNEVESLLSYK